MHTAHSRSRLSRAPHYRVPRSWIVTCGKTRVRNARRAARLSPSPSRPLFPSSTLLPRCMSEQPTNSEQPTRRRANEWQRRGASLSDPLQRAAHLWPLSLIYAAEPMAHPRERIYTIQLCSRLRAMLGLPMRRLKDAQVEANSMAEMEPRPGAFDLAGFELKFL